MNSFEYRLSCFFVSYDSRVISSQNRAAKQCCTLILCTLSLLANSSSLLLISIWWTRCMGGAQNTLASFDMQREAQISCSVERSSLGCTVFLPPPSPAPCGKWPGPGILGRVSGGLSGSACVCTPCLEQYAHSWWSDDNNSLSRVLSIWVFEDG